MNPRPSPHIRLACAGAVACPIASIAALNPALSAADPVNAGLLALTSAAVVAGVVQGAAALRWSVEPRGFAWPRRGPAAGAPPAPSQGHPDDPAG